jgi:hypothetical protein
MADSMKQFTSHAPLQLRLRFFRTPLLPAIPDSKSIGLNLIIFARRYVDYASFFFFTYEVLLWLVGWWESCLSWKFWRELPSHIALYNLTPHHFHPTMGNTFCGNPSGPALRNSQHGDETNCTDTASLSGFSGTESAHLNSVRKSVCQETNGDASFIGVVWKHAHFHAGGGHGQSQSAQRCSQLGAICNTLSISDSLNCVLKQKFNSDDFLEFTSIILTTGNHSRSTLDFAWEVCCCDGSSISGKDTTPARNIIRLCLEISALVHYMLLDEAFETSNGSVSLREERNSNGEKNMIQSLTNSLLEYASCNGGNEFDFGGHSNSTASPEANDNESITKQQFTEWQRKTLRDLLNNSIVQFFHILFFPPKYNNASATNGLFRQYTRPPILYSSKERMAQNAARLKQDEVVPIKSVFGKNYMEGAGGDSLGRLASTVSSPEVFVFTSVSASKFGNKVQ